MMMNGSNSGGGINVPADYDQVTISDSSLTSFQDYQQLNQQELLASIGLAEQQTIIKGSSKTQLIINMMLSRSEN